MTQMIPKYVDTSSWRNGPVITVYHNPKLLAFDGKTVDGKTAVVRWVLFADGGFVAGDAQEFLHADTGFEGKYGKYIATGWCIIPKTGNPRIHVVDCPAISGFWDEGLRARRADFVQLTDAFRAFMEPYTRLEFLPGILDDDPNLP